MKKLIIKRRKRVVPAALQSEHPFNGQQNQSPQAPSVSPNPYQQARHYISNTEPSRINPDGSVNMEARQQEVDGSSNRQILPEPSQFQSQQQRVYHPPPVDFTSYAATSLPTPQNQQHMSDSTLPPISYPSPTQRHLSISPRPNSGGRKRSFSTSESEIQEGSENMSDPNKPNRLSSIKSILNPTQHVTDDIPIEPSLLGRNNSIPSVTSKGSISSGTGESDIAASHFIAPNITGGNEDNRRRTTEKRAELRRETERIRQMLEAKERELAELNNDNLDPDE
ncbi:MAG: putative electron transfer flavoprotein subunit [Geoglossum simile]|nr:MAG: putative electron transfer flavoprotein subunit [Geoglossum simile]